MEVKKASDKTETITHRMIDVEGEKFKGAILVELLEALEGTDGFFTGVVIYDSKIKKKLEDMEVVSSNIRGASSPSKNFGKFKKLVEEIYYED